MVPTVTATMEERRRLRFTLAQHRMTRNDFARAYAQGRRAQGEAVAVVVLENGLDRLRMGLSVGKRYARDAVPRNRMRRVLREAVRLAQHELPSGVDVVLVANVPGAVPRLAELRAALPELVARALRKAPRKIAPPRGDRA
jgi:ribonuclease P protein component